MTNLDPSDVQAARERLATDLGDPAVAHVDMDDPAQVAAAIEAERDASITALRGQLCVDLGTVDSALHQARQRLGELRADHVYDVEAVESREGTALDALLARLAVDVIAARALADQIAAR